MTVQHRLALPPELVNGHVRLHSNRAPQLGNNLPWIPRPAQQRLALSEASVATDKYIAIRADLERKAKWAGIKRNAKRFFILRRLWVLGRGYLKYEFQVTQVVPFAVMLMVVASLVGMTYLAIMPGAAKEITRFTQDHFQVFEPMHSLGIGTQKPLNQEVAVKVSSISVSSTSPIVSTSTISDPKRLTDTSLEPGLPLKLSLSFPDPKP